MAANVGENATIEVKAGGDAGGGSYNEVTLARDLSVPSTATEADKSSRTNEFKVFLPGQIALAVEFDAILDTTDTNGVAVLRTAFYTKALVGVKIRHAGGTSAGVQFDGYVTEFTPNEPLDDTNTVSIRIVPSTDPTLIAAS